MQEAVSVRIEAQITAGDIFHHLEVHHKNVFDKLEMRLRINREKERTMARKSAEM